MAPRTIVSPRFRTVLEWLVGALIVKVTLEVMLGYRNYLPPNFDSDFLRGRERYFYDGYHWAFYAHIASGPVSLLLGLLLMSEQFRRRWPRWHRYLGRVQVLCVLLVVVPSGLWMARHTLSGPVGGLGLAVLGLATGVCISLGWRAAVRRKFAVHQRWMWRTFLLLASAVVIRLAGGLATVTEFDAPWFDPLNSWLSWLGPLAIYEIVIRREQWLRRHSSSQT